MANFILCANCGVSVNTSKNPKTKRFCSNACSHAGRNPSAQERFWSRVNKLKSDQCWEWTGHQTRGGYGHLGIKKKQVLTHRFSWVLHNGEIPNGMLVCHKCDNPKCVNPSHLFLGSHIDNNSDRARKGRNRNQNGVNNTMAQLSADQARESFQLYESGSEAKEIAEKFGVSRATILDVISARSWNHLGLPASKRLARLKRVDPSFDIDRFSKIFRLEAQKRGMGVSGISRATNVPLTVVCRTLKGIKAPMQANLDALACWAGIDSKDFLPKSPSN